MKEVHIAAVHTFQTSAMAGVRINDSDTTTSAPRSTRAFFLASKSSLWWYTLDC